MTDKKVIHKEQINQTKVNFQEALLDLLKQTPISSIKVNKLAIRAGYARRTFYRYYQGVDDILWDLIDSTTHKLFMTIQQKSFNHFKDFVVYFFQFWQDEMILLNILYKNNRLFWLSISWTNYIDESAILQRRNFTNYYQQQFSIGAMFQLLQSWIKQTVKETPEQMGEIAQTIIIELQRDSL